MKISKISFWIIILTFLFLFSPSTSFSQEDSFYKNFENGCNSGEKIGSNEEILRWVLSSMAKKYTPSILQKARKAEASIRKHTSFSGEFSSSKKQVVNGEPKETKTNKYFWSTRLNLYGLDKVGIKCGLEKPSNLFGKNSKFTLKAESIQGVSNGESESRITFGVKMNW